MTVPTLWYSSYFDPFASSVSCFFGSFYKPSGLLSAPTWTFARGIIGNPSMRLLCLWQEKHIIKVKPQRSTLTPFIFTMIYRVRMAGIAVLTWSQDTQPTSRAVCLRFLSFNSIPIIDMEYTLATQNIFLSSIPPHLVRESIYQRDEIEPFILA